ncbi:cytochrome b N-terminal domain-containing protein [bacterium]|nr:cytochrome b N-terminal domain-containing protein [bacterium]
MKDSLALHFWPVKTHRNDLRLSYHLGLGLTTTWLMFILTVTGVLLMFYYRPSVPLAYQDMVDLREGVYPFGMFLRNMHRWAAHVMVFTTIFHMARVFFTGSYKPPRQLNWTIGVILLVLTLLLSFTGYLLPWDQLSMWAITVGKQMAANTPIIGHLGPFSIVDATSDAAFGLVGGTEIGPAGLIRFYVLHVFFLPFVLTILIAYHFWRIRKDGFSFPQT